MQQFPDVCGYIEPVVIIRVLLMTSEQIDLHVFEYNEMTHRTHTYTHA